MLTFALKTSSYKNRALFYLMLAPPLLLGSNQSMSGNEQAREESSSPFLKTGHLSKMIYPLGLAQIEI